MGKRKNKNSYKKLRTAHSKYRAWQRYEIQLNRFDLKGAVTKIQTNKANFVKRLSHRVSEWIVEVKGETLRVLYDKKHQCIVTVLPKQKGFQ
jgi:hypothetical protein